MFPSLPISFPNCFCGTAESPLCIPPVQLPVCHCKSPAWRGMNGLHKLYFVSVVVKLNYWCESASTPTPMNLARWATFLPFSSTKYTSPVQNTHPCHYIHNNLLPSVDGDVYWCCHLEYNSVHRNLVEYLLYTYIQPGQVFAVCLSPQHHPRPIPHLTVSTYSKIFLQYHFKI